MNTFQTFIHLCKNGNTPFIFKRIYTLKPFNKHTIKSKNVLPKPLCKNSFAKVKLIHLGPQLWNNDLLEAVTINIFKTHKKNIFASTNILKDFLKLFSY